MKRAALLALLTCSSLLVQACASTSADQVRRSEAWSRCRTAPNPEVRDRCIKTEVALMEARERNETESRENAQREAEDRQGVLEAHGVPSDEARQTVDSGLRIPD